MNYSRVCGRSIFVGSRHEIPHDPGSRAGQAQHAPGHAVLRGDSESATRIIGFRRTEARILKRALRRDLDWVIMKCLEKDRERRYDTANALAGELKRYLDGEVVQAGRPSAVYRFRKFVRRNKGPVAATTAVSMHAGARDRWNHDRASAGQG